MTGWSAARATVIGSGFTLFVFAVSGLACSRAPQSVVETRSPNGRYLVRLSGQFDEPEFFLDTYRVFVEVDRDNIRLIENEEFYYAGFLDSGFRRRFNAPVWTDGNVLWFENSGAKTKTRDEVWIINELNRTVEALRIEARDTFLVFDIPAEAELRLEATTFRAFADESWFHVKGFGKRDRDLYATASHSLTQPRAARDRYDILISAAGVNIHRRSPD